jgi:hypothetical protein
MISSSPFGARARAFALPRTPSARWLIKRRVTSAIQRLTERRFPEGERPLLAESGSPSPPPVSARLRNHKGRFLVACDHREKLSTGIDAVIGPRVISKAAAASATMRWRHESCHLNPLRSV